MSVSAIFFDGFGNVPEFRAQALSRMLGLNVTAVPYWNQTYDVGFDPQRALATAANQASEKSSENLLVIGASIGGRLAADFASSLQRSGRKVALLLLSPVASARDLNRAAPLLRMAPDWLIDPVLPDITKIWLARLPKSERTRMAEYYALCDAIPWRIKQSQLAYVSSMKPPEPGSLEDMPTFGIWVQYDTIVKFSSYLDYRSATSGRLKSAIYEGRGHNDFIEYPEMWANWLKPVGSWVATVL